MGGNSSSGNAGGIGAITENVAGLPLWAWIVIAVAVLAVIIVIAVVSAKIVRAKKERREDEQEDEGDFTDDATYDEPAEIAEEVPAKAPAEQPSPSPERQPAQPAASTAAASAQQRPAQPSRTTVQNAAAPAQPAPAQGVQASQAKVYHITKRKADGKWQVKYGGGIKAIKLFDTQVQAIDYAKSLAQNQEASIMIHKEDGTFRKLRYDKPNK